MTDAIDTRELKNLVTSVFSPTRDDRHLLLMVDVPASRVHDVEQVVSRRHPEVGVGGVGWHIHGLNA